MLFFGCGKVFIKPSILSNLKKNVDEYIDKAVSYSKGLKNNDRTDGVYWTDVVRPYLFYFPCKEKIGLPLFRLVFMRMPSNHPTQYLLTIGQIPLR